MHKIDMPENSYSITFRKMPFFIKNRLILCFINRAIYPPCYAHMSKFKIKNLEKYKKTIALV